MAATCAAMADSVLGLGGPDPRTTVGRVQSVAARLGSGASDRGRGKPFSNRVRSSRRAIGRFGNRGADALARLVWMLISWALRRRPRQEREDLVEVALDNQPDPNSQKEVQTMSTTLGQTLTVEQAAHRAEARGDRATMAAGLGNALPFRR